MLTFFLQSLLQFFDLEPLHFYDPRALLFNPIDFLLKHGSALLVPLYIFFVVLEFIHYLFLLSLLV